MFGALFRRPLLPRDGFLLCVSSEQSFLSLSFNFPIYGMGTVTSPVPLGCFEGQKRQGESGTILDPWTLEAKLLFPMVFIALVIVVVFKSQ